MSGLLLVRHGRAAAGWQDDSDPGLDEVGRHEAERVADALSGYGPMGIVVSPLRRTRETAAPLERRWATSARVEPRVGEIATPDGMALAERGTWLRDLAGRRWPELDPDLQAWRRGVIEALLAIEGDAVVVTHFVAINAAVGWATGDDRVLTLEPANCSVTALQADAGREQLTLAPA